MVILMVISTIVIVMIVVDATIAVPSTSVAAPSHRPLIVIILPLQYVA